MRFAFSGLSGNHGLMNSLNTKNAPASVRSKTGTFLTGVAWLLGVGGVVAVLLAAIGYRTETLALGTAIQSIRWAATGALAGAVVALLALVWVVRAGGTGRWTAVAALALNAVVVAPPLYLLAQARSLPLIHDISTDTSDPPRFVAILPLRSSAPNPVEYDPANAAEQQRGYPDIAPLVLMDTTPAQAFAHAERAARAMGWDIASTAPEEGRLEATDSTLLLGFKDDIVVRIREHTQGPGQGQGSVVDVRSLSRVGLSDIGTNARRVRAFLGRLQAQ